MAYNITKNSMIGELLDYDQHLEEIFLSMGMHCLGCPASRGETLEEACAVHGIDCEKLIQKLRTKLK